MTTFAVKTESDRARLLKALGLRKLPFTSDVVNGLPRSTKQNRTQRMWHKEASEQGDKTPEENRAYCKLHFGVAIMKYESPEWADAYDRIIKPLTYEQKLEMMAEPIDFPVTRCMSMKGKAKFMEEIHNHYTSLGYLLTIPNDDLDSAGDYPEAQQ